MAKPAEKLKALALRREGNSVKDIARMLGVSSGSVGVWCRDIELTEAQVGTLLARQQTITRD